MVAGYEVTCNACNKPYHYYGNKCPNCGATLGQTKKDIEAAKETKKWEIKIAKEKRVEAHNKAVKYSETNNKLKRRKKRKQTGR